MISKEEFKDRIKNGKLKTIRALKYPYKEGIKLRWTLFGVGGVMERNNMAGEFTNYGMKMAITADKAYDLVIAGFFECVQPLPGKEREIIRDDYAKARRSTQAGYSRRKYL